MSHTRAPWRSDRAGLEEASSALAQGQVVGFPTDTVYGLAASAGIPEALRLLSRTKGRAEDQPLILMSATASGLDPFVIWTPAARRLARRFWPGPLTLILRATSLAAPLGGEGTVGVRIPDHSVALRLLRIAGPLGTSSANRHGQPPLPDAAAALAQLPQLAGALDSPQPASTETEPSSILDLAHGRPVLIREGRLRRRELGLLVTEYRSGKSEE